MSFFWTFCLMWHTTVPLYIYISEINMEDKVEDPLKKPLKGRRLGWGICWKERNITMSFLLKGHRFAPPKQTTDFTRKANKIKLSQGPDRHKQQ